MDKKMSLTEDELSNITGGYETLNERTGVLTQKINGMYKNDKGQWIYYDNLPAGTVVKIIGRDIVWGTSYLEVIPNGINKKLFIAEQFIK